MSASSFDYRMIDPISGPIDPKKQGTLRHWGSHPYFTRRAWNVVQEYIKRFSQVGDVVLDPFGGSGVTAVEALVLKRKAIYSDINPMAGFICRNIAVSPVNIDDFRSAFDDIARNCQEKIEEVYRMSPEEAADLEIPYWYPQGVRLPKNADAESVENLFTKRQLFSLSLILNQIELR
ncbi:DNA methyltransferase, partial [Microcystis aeruginosa]